MEAYILSNNLCRPVLSQSVIITDITLCNTIAERCLCNIMHFIIIFCYLVVNCNWVDTQWQQYSAYLHTDSSQNLEHRTYISYTLAFALQLRKKHS
jgi:hypothetical protein